MPKKFGKRWKENTSIYMDLKTQSLDRVSTELSLNFEAVNEDAQKILKEAAAMAEQKKARLKPEPSQ